MFLVALKSECEPRLQLQPAVVRSLGEPTEACAAGGLIGVPEEWRRDIANDWPGIRVIEDVLRGQGDA